MLPSICRDGVVFLAICIKRRLFYTVSFQRHQNDSSFKPKGRLRLIGYKWWWLPKHMTKFQP